MPGGASTADSFWSLLRDGVDAIQEIPADRWNVETFYDPELGTPGKTNAKWGGFVEDIDRFDADFFGISPREATRIDPQQRLLLEVAWEGLEDAGLVPSALAGTSVGVFAGLSSADYMLLAQSDADLSKIDAHTNTGSAMSIAANRVSYALDLRGPSVAVDTACSSSLVAVHLACQSIWQGEVPLALAGGVNVLINPEPYIGFSRLAMLSPEGRCRAFDSRANGFVRSEGAALVVLKPYARALADGDRIYALIRATAVNQDGRTNGLTVPNRKAQEELVRAACDLAGVEPRQVQFVEAHGTGTLVGDPIEARALGKVLAEGRADGTTCAIGSVKTNIGHLEPAAGIAGLIKVALALHQGLIPPNLHFEAPNPDIPFDELKLRVQTKLVPWCETDEPPIAGVNSFGFGGTNAHAVLQGVPAAPLGAASVERPPEIETASSSSRPALIALSARSADALAAQAERWCAHLDLKGPGCEISLDDVAYTSLLRRDHLEHRLSIVAADRAELLEKLGAYAEGERRPGMSVGRAAQGKRPRLAFIASGQGPQWWGMGRRLLETEPEFRGVIERADAIIRELGRWSLLEELTAPEEASRMAKTSIAQPCIFALQVGLARLLARHGVEPEALLGHSVGEVAAAHLAGALDFEQATRVIFHRGRCMDFAEAQGRMLAASLDVEQAEQLAAKYGDGVSLAANNSPTSVAFSGDAGLLEEIAKELDGRGVFQKFLRVEYAFHSAQMDPLRDELLAALSDLTPRTAKRALISSVTGERVDGSELDAEYWWRNVRQTVRFAAGADALLEDGVDLFVELAPHPVLSGYLKESAHARRARAVVLPTLKRDSDEPGSLVETLGALHANGFSPDLTSIAPAAGRFASLPLYPWQREHYWNEGPASKARRTGPSPHALLGSRTPAAAPTWSSRVDLRAERWLRDHRVQGCVLLSATSFIEMALSAALELHGPVPCAIEDLQLLKACFLEQEQPRVLEFSLDGTLFRISSRPADGERVWTEHARGRLRVYENPAPPALDLDCVSELERRTVNADDAYRLLAECGLEYGPTFRGLCGIWIGSSESVGRIEAPQEIQLSLERERYRFHPALLDACFQALTGVLDLGSQGGRVFFPVELANVRCFGAPTPVMWSRVRLRGRSARSIVADVSVADESGRVLLEVEGFRCRSVEDTDAVGEGTDDLVYEYRWRLAPLASEEGVRRSAAHLAPLTDVVDATRSGAAELEGALDLLDLHQRMEADLAGLCVSYLWRAFGGLGAGLRVGERLGLEAFVERLGVHPRYERLLSRYLAILADAGLLRRVGNEGSAQWEVRRATADALGDPVSDWRALLTHNPAFYAELTLLGRCGPRLAEILRGDLDPMQLIFPEGSLAIAEHLYQDSPSLRFFNTLAQRAVQALTASLPHGKNLRVLEIGAGTGGMTSYVLPGLPADRTEYVYTDLSNHFFVKAEEKFRDYPFLRFERLDIENAPADQGFDAHSFDLIIASECLHATTDLAATLENVRWLLASEGVLLMLEAVRSQPWVDLVFGLTEGWWRFTDETRRTDSPLLAMHGWRQLLLEEGFEEIHECVGLDEKLVDNALIITRGPTLADAEPRAVRQADAIADAEPHSAREADAIADERAADTAECAADTSEPELAVKEEGTWLVLGDAGGCGDALAAELEAAGQRCIVARAGTAWRADAGDRYVVAADDKDALARLIHEIPGAPLRGIVHLWSLDAPLPEETTGVRLDASLAWTGLSVVHLAQLLDATGVAVAPRLWLVSQGAQSVTSSEAGAPEPTAPARSTLWGVGRVVAEEIPKLRPALVDLRAADAQEISALARELLCDGEEDELALRGGARYVHRYERLTENAQRAAGSGAAAVEAFRLEPSPTGMLDRLTLRATQRSAPGPGRVEIEIAVAGLNFSDVMKGLGLYPGLDDGPVPLGSECSGRVVALGPGVEDAHGLAVGDEVIAIAPFAFASHVEADARFVVKKPSHIGLEEAATLPVAFLTCWYALHHLGRIQPGERILIHSATGGVGMAAVQIARSAGAVVYATAGTPEKRDFLRALGIEHVFDSRSLAFADELMEATGGEGVDLVLNSLAGDAIGKGLSVLRDYGRFLEIGKRDIYADTRVGLKPFRRNLSFIAIDLDHAMRQRTDLLASLFREWIAEVEAKRLSPLPFRVFPVFNVVGAFRTMSQAKHIGKVLVSMRGAHAEVAPPLPQEASFRADASYLVTGGLGGFGCIVARWMVDRGARHLVLAGRSGASSEEAVRTVEELRAAGAEVRVARLDVTDRAGVDALIAEIGAEMPPLRGVIHAAMVLKDRLLADLNEERMREVWAPKVHGAWNLHAATLGHELDFFVLFSSLSSVFGVGGQANYASGNAFLDALSYQRRAAGLPSVTISWGYLADVGWVARHDEIGQRLKALGVKSFTPRQALHLLARFLVEGPPHLGVMSMDWRLWGEVASKTRVSPRFAALVQASATGEDQGGRRSGTAIKGEILAAPAEERLPLVIDVVRSQVARVLGAAPAKLDVEKSLTQLGLDSLMAVELRNWIEGELRLSLPTVELMSGPTVVRLAELLLEQIESPDSASAQAKPAPRPTEAPSANAPALDDVATAEQREREEAAALLEKVDELSDDEVDAELERMLTKA